jgi:putative DNA primase/helicase
MRADLAEVIKQEFDRLALDNDRLARKVTRGLVLNAQLALSGMTLLDPRTEPPAWLDGRAGRDPAEILVAKNGLVHLPSVAAGRPAIRPPTPAYFAPHALRYDFDPLADLPATWLTFLETLWPHDPESIATLQEWFGYLLTPDTTQQKILMMIGPKRSGRGTIARVARALVGAENVAHPTLASLATNFGLAPLIGKLSAVITDARLSGRTDLAAVVERLLSVSGEDAQTIDRKHLSAVTVKLPTRFTVISNELPRLTDTSGALAGRMIILRLTESFYGREDPGLTAKLLGELPGILLWAIGGWQRLRERGHFVQPKAAEDMVAELEDLASPVGAFVRQRCEVAPGRDEAVDTLYRAWCDWCADAGRKEPGDKQSFGRNLRAVVPGIKTVRPRNDTDRIRKYEGISLCLPDQS